MNREQVIVKIIKELYKKSYTFKELQIKFPDVAWTTLRHCVNSLSHGEYPVLNRTHHKSRDKRIYSISNKELPESMYENLARDYYNTFENKMKQYRKQYGQKKKERYTHNIT